MTNSMRSSDEQERIRELARLWWELQGKIAALRKTIDAAEGRYQLLIQEHNKIACGLADFQTSAGQFAIVLHAGVLIVRNQHRRDLFLHGRGVEWIPDQSRAPLAEREVNSAEADHPFLIDEQAGNAGSQI